ncbi:MULTISPECIES: WhiB family transcriptional regulator [unclassified Streptomyces]|uniref:WhiB family transcriptional regulator n=1 Tax=unclassified Streptomyces TaxID=2593676 RepID=UPI0033AD7829
MTGRLAPFPRFTGTEPCQAPGAEPDWWTSDDSNDRAAAQLACRRCPTREACLAWAIDHPTDAGDAIWAGTTRHRRRELCREFAFSAQEKK